MNVGNILATVGAIRHGTVPNLGFNMRSWYQKDAGLPDRSGRGRGETSCMAGWAAYLVAGERSRAVNLYGESAVPDLARVFLQMSEQETHDAFVCFPGIDGRGDPTAEDAAVYLETFLENRKTNWVEVMKLRAAKARRAETLASIDVKAQPNFIVDTPTMMAVGHPPGPLRYVRSMCGPIRSWTALLQTPTRATSRPTDVQTLEDIVF